MKLALLTLVLASALAVVTRASNEDAETTLRAAVDQVLTVAQKAKSGSSMADQITPVLLRYVCFESMTRRAVGPGWRQFTPDQKAEATKLFTKLIIRSYSEKFTPGEQPDTKYLLQPWGRKGRDSNHYGVQRQPLQCDLPYGGPRQVDGYRYSGRRG